MVILDDDFSTITSRGGQGHLLQHQELPDVPALDEWRR